MKINPSNIQSPKQAKAFNFAQSVIKRVDTVFDAIKGYDQTDKDFNKTPGSVLVDEVLLGTRASLTQCRTDGATIHQKGDTTIMEANAQVAGTGYFYMPTALDTEMTKVDSPKSTKYKIKFEGNVVGPSTQVVEINKETGEWNVQKLWMGLIPGRID